MDHFTTKPRFQASRFFDPCRSTYESYQTAQRCVGELAERATHRLFPERMAYLGQPLGKVYYDGLNLRQSASSLELEWRQRLFTLAVAWTTRTGKRDGTDLRPERDHAWLPVEVLELACLEGYAIHETAEATLT